MMDLLAGVGHTSAQAAMVSILSDERTQSTSHFIRLVQSTSLLLEPELETIEFLGDLTSSMNAPLGSGSCRGIIWCWNQRLSAHGHKDDADRLNADLNAMLRDSESEAVTCGLLFGMGNARRDENYKSIAPHLKSESMQTRLVATRALRHLHSPESRESLMSMMDDVEPLVQESALRAMGTQGIGDVELRRIEAALQAGSFSSNLLPDVIRTVANTLKPGVSIDRFVQFYALRPDRISTSSVRSMKPSPSKLVESPI